MFLKQLGQCRKSVTIHHGRAQVTIVITHMRNAVSVDMKKNVKE